MPTFDGVRSALEHAEKAVIESALNRPTQGPDVDAKVQALEDALIAVCAVLRELVDYVDEERTSA